jgi:hypothetical protein
VASISGKRRLKEKCERGDLQRKEGEGDLQRKEGEGVRHIEEEKKEKERDNLINSKISEFMLNIVC